MEKGEELLFHGDFKVPEDLTPIIKELVKGIFRKGLESRDEIIEFGKKYFQDLDAEKENRAKKELVKQKTDKL